MGCVFALSLAVPLSSLLDKGRTRHHPNAFAPADAAPAAAEPRWVWWPDAYIHNHNINLSAISLASVAFGMMEEEPEAQIWEQMAINNLYIS